MPPMRVLVAGMGWLGEAVARELAAAGHEVTGVRRKFPDEAGLQAAGIRPLACDLADFHAVRRLPEVDAVVVCTAPQAHGEDVDEDTPVRPLGPMAEILVEAEHRVRGATAAVPTRIVRLSGLYGPGRMGILDRVRRGQLALGADELHWMNFCHRDDAVAFVRGALEGGAAGAVYHGSDAHPAPRRDVVWWIAQRLGIQPAVHPEGSSSPHRRVLSEKSRRALGIVLRYPSYREGFEAALRAP